VPIYIPNNEIGTDPEVEAGADAGIDTRRRKRTGFAFVEGFTELLTTSLVARGLDVRTCVQRTCSGVNATDGTDGKPNALVVDVRYSVYAFQPKNIYYTGELTSLTAGLIAVAGIVDGGGVAHRPVSYAGKLLGVAMLQDAAFWASHNSDTGPSGKYMRSVPKTEILLTASVTQGDKIVVRRSNVYFATDEDAALYWQGFGGKTMRVKGGE
jgi:hypothetical protein